MRHKEIDDKDKFFSQMREHLDSPGLNKLQKRRRRKKRKRAKSSQPAMHHVASAKIKSVGGSPIKPSHRRVLRKAGEKLKHGINKLWNSDSIKRKRQWLIDYAIERTKLLTASKVCYASSLKDEAASALTSFENSNTSLCKVSEKQVKLTRVLSDTSTANSNTLHLEKEEPSFFSEFSKKTTDDDILSSDVDLQDILHCSSSDTSLHSTLTESHVPEKDITDSERGYTFIKSSKPCKSQPGENVVREHETKRSSNEEKVNNILRCKGQPKLEDPREYLAFDNTTARNANAIVKSIAEYLEQNCKDRNKEDESQFHQSYDTPPERSNQTQFIDNWFHYDASSSKNLRSVSMQPSTTSYKTNQARPPVLHQKGDGISKRRNVRPIHTETFSDQQSSSCQYLTKNIPSLSHCPSQQRVSHGSLSKQQMCIFPDLSDSDSDDDNIARLRGLTQFHFPDLPLKYPFKYPVYNHTLSSRNLVWPSTQFASCLSSSDSSPDIPYSKTFSRH
ncbi:unnamed protein product [Clavelina lepadiformis]|uniref:Uncharacterized protein n=1 Tax=Clavelina lepadiformis TaxID=159417 RepID=A0ABP0F8S5_CLALP